jgi:hypothetical protein
MNRWAVGLAVGLAVFLWSKRVQYRAEADSRVLIADSLGGGDVFHAEATGEGRRTLRVRVLSCERFPSEADQIRLRNHGFTRLLCDSAGGGSRSAILAEPPFLASVLDPD